MNVGIGAVRSGSINVADMAIMLDAGMPVFESSRSGKHGHVGEI